MPTVFTNNAFPVHQVASRALQQASAQDVLQAIRFWAQTAHRSVLRDTTKIWLNKQEILHSLQHAWPATINV